MNMLYRLPAFLTDTAEGSEEYVPTIWDILTSPTIIMMVVLVIAMYFLMIRPESKRKKAAIRMRNELIVGDEVTMTSGIVGRIVNIKDDTITIETGSDKTRITFMKNAIATKREATSA